MACVAIRAGDSAGERSGRGDGPPPARQPSPRMTQGRGIPPPWRVFHPTCQPEAVVPGVAARPAVRQRKETVYATASPRVNNVRVREGNETQNSVLEYRTGTSERDTAPNPRSGLEFMYRKLPPAIVGNQIVACRGDQGVRFARERCQCSRDLLQGGLRVDRNRGSVPSGLQGMTRETASDGGAEVPFHPRQCCVAEPVRGDTLSASPGQMVPDSLPKVRSGLSP